MDYRPEHVLIVEDNPTNRRILQHMLSKLDVPFDVATNGLEAVEMVKERRYACILMDMMMPVMDGLEAAREIRKLEQQTHSRTPIIAVTANADPSDERKCLEAGMDAFISKPFTVGQLSRTFSSTMGSFPSKKKPQVINNSILSTFVRTMGDDDSGFIQELLLEFLNQAIQVRSELHAGLTAKDGKKIALEVHSLRGSAAVVGAEKLAEMCLEIERWAERNAFDEIELRLARFEGSINEVRSELDRLTSYLNTTT